jgi:small subunit ribosomal protein S1
VIFGKVKGGFTVDISGAVAFLPNSQLDIRPIRDASALMNVEQPFIILKMDRKRGNIVVSRRAILEESKAEAQAELIGQIHEGQILQGIVKNITDYGAFVDLGGVDGLLHVTDISWKRINHPSEVLQVGQNITVKVIRFNDDTKRVSLGMKQLDDDPWKNIAANFPVGSRHVGVVTNVADYGAFVELTSGIEGLVHVSEMSWTRKNATPNQLVSISQSVEVMVLEIDMDKRRISLGMKQCQDNPWSAFAAQHPVGSTIEAEVLSTNKNGVVVSVGDDLEGFISAHDLTWDKNGAELVDTYVKGSKVTAKVLDINPEKDSVSLGIKQLTSDPFGDSLKELKKGAIVTCTITKLQDNGIEVEVTQGLTGFIKKSDLSRDRSEQHADRFAIGEKVDAMIITLDKSARKVSLSIKAREVEEEKQVMAEYGSTDSGASLGDILGPVMNRAVSKEEADSDTTSKAAKTKKAKAKDA